MDPLFSKERDWSTVRPMFLRLEKLLELAKGMAEDRTVQSAETFFTIVKRLSNTIRSALDVANTENLTQILDLSVAILHDGARLTQKILDCHIDDIELWDFPFLETTTFFFLFLLLKNIDRFFFFAVRPRYWTGWGIFYRTTSWPRWVTYCPLWTRSSECCTKLPSFTRTSSTEFTISRRNITRTRCKNCWPTSIRIFIERSSSRSPD